MSASVKGFVITVLLLIALGLGCKSSGNKGSGAANNANAKTSSAKPDNQGIIHSGNGEEKEKPAAGKANVSGKVFYNEKAAANIEVKLCEKYQSVFRRVQRPSLHSE
ncbi:MAG TPA: hypothetical protein VN920_15355, partial [Pyrinomonadaceae bacterium]|nr:hypothetical protein [Pyrinomonadaceae bacterium]